ncbi:hypothetical protein BGZ95_004607, partial [Linnemannia exigua]
MISYVDGAAAVEKKDTHRKREKKRIKALASASSAVKVLKDRVDNGKAPTSQQFKDVTKALHGAFKWSLQDRIDFVAFLHQKQLQASLCNTEADVAIAVELAKVLEYRRSHILTKVTLTCEKLTALCCVSQNDYNSNVKSLGVASNYKIIQSLQDSVFVDKLQERVDNVSITPDSFLLSATPESTSTSSSASSRPSLPLSFGILRQQNQAVIEKNNLFKQQEGQRASEKRATPNNCKPNRQGKGREYRRHRTIDNPAHQPEVSRQVHRPRYSLKARPAPQQHEPPDVCKQYQWKPYTAAQEARHQQSIDEAKKRETEKKRRQESRQLQQEKDLAKKQLPRIDKMNKMQLLNAMAWEHLLVALPVGTVSSNSKRAAAEAVGNVDQPNPSEQPKLLVQEVTCCILDIVEQVRTTKRHTQEFLGSFIETSFKQGLTEDDRAILSYLCPAVKSKIKGDASISSSSIESVMADGDDDDDDEESNDDSESSAADQPFIAFYNILMAHVYSRKIKSKTVAERQVGLLLARATTLGITLPPVPQRVISYPTKPLLELTVNQLFRSMKLMYRNGTIALEEKLGKEDTNRADQNKDAEATDKKEDTDPAAKKDTEAMDKKQDADPANKRKETLPEADASIVLALANTQEQDPTDDIRRRLVLKPNY